MVQGSIFTLHGRTFRTDSFECDQRGWLRVVIARCLEPLPEDGTKRWWAIEIVPEDGLGLDIHTVH